MTSRVASTTDTETLPQLTDEEVEEARSPWKMIIADDQEEVHSVTKLVLNDFTFRGRGLQFLSAYSGAETKALIEKHPDVAFILLDVVMETDNAGLDVVRHIREKIKNSIVQIVLNTGQPGQAPETEVITKYDINDYKSKTDFSSRKLLTSITSSLRAYSQAKNLQLANERLARYRNHLEELVKERTAALEAANRQLQTEIEERTLADEALKQSYDILNNILTASPIGICLVKNGHIEWGNDELLTMFGFKSESDYKNSNTHILFASEKEYLRVDQSIRNQSTSSRPIEVDAVLKRKDGETFPGNLKLSCENKEQYQEETIITISDISWRIQAEKDRVQKERLQGALEMSGSICHELNQPLQYISGSIEILVMDLPADEPLLKTMAKLKIQVDRMGSITRKLMGITSYETRDYVGGRRIIDIDKASQD